MDRMLYVAMNGASQTLQAQAVNSHNLANVSTAGFRQDLAAFRSMPVFGDGLPSRVYAMEERPGVDDTVGPMTSTGRDLDVAIHGEGWLAVQAPDGGEAYTRAGDLRISAAGILTTGAGHPVLGNAGPVAIPPAQKLEIGTDGTISIHPLGEPATTLVELDRLRLVKPAFDDLVKGPDGLMRRGDGEPAAPDATVKLTTGVLEGSNVNVVEALVNMIDLARQYELQVKAMATAQDNAAATAQLMRL